MRVLIIEDNDDNLELITFLLENAGFTNFAAITGEEGIEKIGQNCYDLIISDIQLPGLDGQETLEQIRQLPNGAKVPAIAMTSYAMAGDREKLLAAGFDGYIEKPIDPERVITQINQIVSQCHENPDRR